MTLPEIVFHLPRSWLGPFGTGLLPFYDKLTEGLTAAGVAWSVTPLDRDGLDARIAADARFHVINHGRLRHRRVLNAGIAYVYPFWNMDPWGIRAFSSIAEVPFRPARLDPDIARPFFRRLRRRLVGARTSRYAQPESRTVVAPGTAAVFFQSEGHRIVGETCYLDRWEMLEATLAGWDGPVLVKPHPRDTDPETLIRLQDLAGQSQRLQIAQDANIHDLIAGADRVVTINSAVGIEAFLHRKPVILCGQADFHHIADTARTQNELQDILRVPARRRAYDKYIYWYFGLNCLATTQPDLTAAFLARVKSQLDA